MYLFITISLTLDLFDDIVIAISFIIALCLFITLYQQPIDFDLQLDQLFIYFLNLLLQQLSLYNIFLILPLINIITIIDTKQFTNHMNKIKTPLCLFLLL